MVRRSDIEKANPGSTDVEIVIVELGLYDHVSTERDQRSTQQTSKQKKWNKTAADSSKTGHICTVEGEEKQDSEARRFDHGGTAVFFHLQSNQLFFLLECVNNRGQQ